VETTFTYAIASSNRSSRSIASLRSKPCGSSKFKVQEFKVNSYVSEIFAASKRSRICSVGETLTLQAERCRAPTVIFYLVTSGVYKPSPFQWFQPFNRCAPFKALRQFKVQGSRVQGRALDRNFRVSGIDRKRIAAVTCVGFLRPRNGSVCPCSTLW
jgi:hypothetical protein